MASTAMDERIPGMETYDPSSATPYSPSPRGGNGAGGQGTDPNAPPPITAPPPSSIGQQPAPTAPKVLPGSKGATAASIAYGLDAVLRGAMKGRDQAQQQQAFKINKLMQGFQYAYQNASQQYLGDRKSTRLNSSHLGISYAV